MNYCPRNTLLSVIQKFYKPETIVNARDIWFDRVPVKEGETRLIVFFVYGRVPPVTSHPNAEDSNEITSPNNISSQNANPIYLNQRRFLRQLS